MRIVLSINLEIIRYCQMLIMGEGVVNKELVAGF